ncbi:MAG: group 1 truncated hemoglobin [Caulobacter sp. 12-67-6]|nr:MAG: group 1 truncated hemoglobin [Caulobacter sp. 12-67-6]OYX71717.1 MAG: group 1 truncated hemoglobin [Caulobacter sp. 32-67-35]
MRHFTQSAALAAVIALGLAGSALAQDAVPPGEQPVDPYVQSNANAGAKPMDDTRVFEAFRGKDGLVRIAADTVDRSMADPRIKEIFATTDVPRLKRTLAEQFCYVLGGGCAYSGRDMAAVHKDMGVTNRDMNALIENLQLAMDKEGVPFFAQNKLLAKLAPMQRSVVER